MSESGLPRTPAKTSPKVTCGNSASTAAMSGFRRSSPAPQATPTHRHRHRSASVLRRGATRPWPDGSPCDRRWVEQPRGSFSPADAGQETPAARISITGLSALASCHSCRCLQLTQLSTTSDLPPHRSRTPVSGVCRVARDCRCLKAVGNHG